MESARPRQITREEQWRITCHEAGHAIVAVKHCLPFQYVERGDGEYGVVELGVNPVDDPDSDWSNDELSHWQEFYAGSAAAERLLFDRDRLYALCCDKKNHAQLEKRRDHSRSDGFEEDVCSARKLLDETSIQNVASELKKKGKLDEEHVYGILGRIRSW